MKFERYHITEKDEYDYCVQHGIEPLIDDKFTIDIKLRVELQESKFGTRKNIPAMNQKFFHWIWLHKDHFCEECGRPLLEYSATFCSHILSRGAYPEMAIDPRNINILCFNHHQQYEFGNRDIMRITKKNAVIIQKLKNEYNNLKQKQYICKGIDESN